MKKYLRILLTLTIVITMVFTLALTATANNGNNGNGNGNNGNSNGNGATVVDASTIKWQDGLGFHCNDIEGQNGKTTVSINGVLYPPNKQEDNGKDKAMHADLARVGTSTKFNLVTKTDIVCSCGRSDWVTYSNNANQAKPSGKNIEVQHDGPSRRWITVQVIYYLEIPACEFTCVNAGAECGFVCTCEDPCPNADKIGHAGNCTMACGEDHACPFDDPELDLTCAAVCNCATSIFEVIVNKRELIVIADGYLFEHTAPDTWKGGEYVSGPKEISETLFNSKTYRIYYEGVGDCACECEPVVCNAKCTPCDYIYIPPPPPPHVCIAVCDNCKNGVGNNHSNHIQQNPESNTNYFCLECGIKLGSWNNNKGWEDADKNPCDPIECLCPTCTDHD